MTKSRIAAAVERVAALYEAGPMSFIEMVRAVGLDPARDFRGADLRGADLSYEDLTAFDLRGANLTGANLTGAQFKLDRMSGAQIRDARLDNILWVRPKVSSFAPKSSWQTLTPGDADLVAFLTQQPHVRELVARDTTVVMAANLSWLLDSELIALMSQDGKTIRHAYFLYSHGEMMTLGRTVWEEQDQLKILGDIDVTPDNVLEYLSFELYFCSDEPWLIARSIEDFEVFGAANNTQTSASVERYLTSITSTPAFASGDRHHMRFALSAISNGRVFPLSGQVSPRGEITYDEAVVVSNEMPVAVIPPHEDSVALFATWASQR